MSTDEELRRVLIGACRDLVHLGLTHGTSGNASVRHGPGFLVSPTGMAYEALEPSDVALVGLDGRWYGRRQPSSEWRFHRDILAARTDVGAIVHAHPRFATALALGEVRVLDAAQMRVVLEKFRTYGRQDIADPDLRHAGEVPP